MITEATLRDEKRLTKLELRNALKRKDYQSAVAHGLYLDFIDFALNWNEND